MPDEQTTTTETTTTTNADQGTGSQPWFQGADAELVGHLQTKGWDKLDPAAAALEASKSQREAEKRLGIPADQVVRWPKDGADEDAWKGLYKRLGVPDDPKEYDLSGLKFKDGTELTDDFTEFLRKTAADLKLNPSQAKDLAQRVMANIDGQEDAVAAEHTAYLQREREALQRDWGQNMEANLAIANAGAAKLGVGQQEVDKLCDVLGHHKALSILHKIGTMSGEAKFFSNPAGGGEGIMTREQAIARRSELKADALWVEKYLNGDAAAGREMTALNRLIAASEGQ